MFNVIEDAGHVSAYPRQLLIELRQMEDESFHQLLKHLPQAFGLLPAGYTNGAFIHTYYSDPKTPSPQFDEHEHEHEIAVDDTDYLAIENGGCLRPGCMLECRGKVVDGEIGGTCATNAAVLA